MTARRTIHAMTDAEVKGAMATALNWDTTRGLAMAVDDAVSIARRLAGPDPRPIVEALREIARFPMDADNIDMTFSEAVAAMAEKARAALDVWEKSE